MAFSWAACKTKSESVLKPAAAAACSNNCFCCWVSRASKRAFSVLSAIFDGEKEGYDFLPNYEDITPNRTKITKENAETLLKDDIKDSEGIINKILNDWEEQGIKPKITQKMYDAMVSMAYNMGPGIRKSDFIQAVKKGDLKTAKELILTTSENLFDDFPGLKTRREKEAKMFT